MRIRLGLAAATWALLLATTAADALTLGRARGAVILGRPLNIAVQATLDTNEPELCAQAELFQGDLRSGPLEVVIERAETSHLIRLRSTVLIEEPMITVYVRAGCGQPFTRSYVLLADQPQDMANAPLALAPTLALAPLPAPAASEPRVERTAPAPAAPPGGALPLRREPTLGARAEPPAPQAKPPAPPTKPKTAAKTAPAAAKTPRPERAKAPAPAAREKTEAAAPKPRLRLEPVDIAVESAPPLKLAPQLSVSETGSATGRTTAAAQWKVLSATPDQLAAQNRRAELMEAELKAMRDAMQKNTATMTLLAAELQNVRSERNIASTALAALAGLMALGMAVLLWLRWRDTSRQHARWQAAVAQESMLDESRIPEAFQPSMDSQVIPDSINSDWIGMSRMDADEMPPTERVPLTPRSVSRPVALGPLPEFAQSEFTAQRVLPGAEELIDIKQKADFFIALGQIGQAIDLLEAQIHDHLGSSPLVWLDLLDICQRFGRRDEYERFRAEFQVAFNARLPEFDGARRVSGGLEDHPRALSRICLLWPSPRVLQVIEESLFGEPHQPSAITFDLEASRDLLLLYGIAKEVVQHPAPTAAPAPGEENSDHGALATQPVPLAALDGVHAQGHHVEVAPDIDLDFLGRAKQVEQPAAPAPTAPAPTQPPEPDAFDFEFEPKARHTRIL